MYKTSPLEIDGQTAIADMKNSKTGAVEKRPVYLNGYNSFGDGSAIEYFGNMGFNALAIEVGINSLILQPGGTHGWTELNRKDDTTAEIVYEKGDKGNSVLKIVSNADAAPNKYLQFYQNYSVKPNTAYEFGFRVKGKNINGLWVAMGGWSTEREYIPEGSYDWKSFSYEYTTNAEQTSFSFFIFADAETGETIYDVEWESVSYDGGTLIRINNYSWLQKPEVVIEVNGEKVSEFTELRSMEKKDGKIVLNPYEPVLIKVN